MHRYNFISIMLLDGKYNERFLAHASHCQECSRAVRNVERSRLESAQNECMDYLLLDGILGICPSTNMLSLYRGDYDGLIKDKYLLTYDQKATVQAHIDVCQNCQQTMKLFTMLD
jgi:hypothetical protein